MFSSFLAVSAVQSFIAEDTGLSYLFIIGVLQVLFLIQYVFIRILYQAELLLLDLDSIHLFVIGLKGKQRVFLNKLGQIILLYTIQYILSLLFMIVFKVSLEVFMLVNVVIATALVLVFLVYLLDVRYMNDMDTNLIESTIQLSLFALLAALFYFPSLPLLVVCCLSVVAVIIVKVSGIWREIV